MKRNALFTLLILVLAAFTLARCGSDNSSQEPEEQNMPEGLDTTSQDIGQEAIKEVEIPQDEERESNLQKAAAVSPFAKLGCCNEPVNYGEDCCCEAVIEHYRSMVAANDTAIARLKMTDPILSSCRKKNQSVFDEIDNPEEDYEDMVEHSTQKLQGA